MDRNNNTFSNPKEKRKIIYSVSHIYSVLTKYNNKTGERGINIDNKHTLNNYYYTIINNYNVISYY